MPHPNEINPATNKRYGLFWTEEEQKQLEKKQELEKIQKEIAILERAQMAQKARDDLLAFTQFTMPDPEAPGDVKRSMYKAARFHKIIAKHLEEVERGDIRQLIFCMPPRHGKTEMATKRMASWYLGRHPNQQVAVATYNDSLAGRFGADTRAIVTSPQYRQVFPNLRLRKGGTAKDNLETAEGGRILFVGRGTALTGSGAHLLLIDDLFKDHEEARSLATREEAWNWFTKVAMTRRMGKKLVIITMTRWHSDDIIGRLTDPENPYYNKIEASKWKIIRLPAFAEEDDPLGRPEGAPLWPDGPDQFDEDFLQSQQRLDPLGFAALYQQRPTVADGVLFRRENIQYWRPETLPTDMRYYCASDFALGTGQRHDFTVHLKVGIDRQDNIYLIECFWQKVKSSVSVEAMLTMARGDTAPLIWWAEKGHISKSIGPFLYKRMAETRTFFTVNEVTPIGDKEQRAQSIAARLSMGKVYFPKESSWTEKAINQLLAFPNGSHDDFVDALAYIGLGLRSQFVPSAPKKQQEEPRFGTLAWVKYQSKYLEQKARDADAGGF